MLSGHPLRLHALLPLRGKGGGLLPKPISMPPYLCARHPVCPASAREHGPPPQFGILETPPPVLPRTAVCGKLTLFSVGEPAGNGHSPGTDRERQATHEGRHPFPPPNEQFNLQTLQSSRLVKREKFRDGRYLAEKAHPRFLSSYFHQGNLTASPEIRKRGFLLSSICIWPSSGEASTPLLFSAPRVLRCGLTMAQKGKALQ